jgi:hypothetical protein
MKQITLNIPDKKLPFFIELAKQLGLEIAKEETPFPSMTDKQIISQAKKANKEIEQGKTLSHNQAYDQFKKW